MCQSSHEDQKEEIEAHHQFVALESVRFVLWHPTQFFQYSSHTLFQIERAKMVTPDSFLSQLFNHRNSKIDSVIFHGGVVVLNSHREREISRGSGRKREGGEVLASILSRSAMIWAGMLLLQRFVILRKDW